MLTEAASSTEYVSGPAQQTGWVVITGGSLDCALGTTVTTRCTTHTQYPH